MTRVMIVIDTHRVSGPAKGLLDFCDAAASQITPLMVVFQRGGEEPTEFREACAHRGLRMEVLWERYRFDPSPLGQAGRVARSFQPDLIQTHGYKADFIGLTLRWQLGVPWIALSHGWTDEGPKMRFYRLLDDRIIRRADRIVAVSRARRAALEEAGCPPGRIVTIHNAVEIRPGAPVDGRMVRQELRLLEDRPVVAVIGRLSPEKGQRYFLEAMAAVLPIVPGVQGLILGDGQEAERLQGQAARLKLDGAIHFLGYRYDMDRIYPAIDLLVLPSLSEGLPNVVLEAMTHGRPVVGTRVGGVPEVVEDGVSGFLVPPADARALAQAIVRLLLDPALCERMGKAARTRVERDFGVAPRAERILSLYRHLLHQRRTPGDGTS